MVSLMVTADHAVPIEPAGGTAVVAVQSGGPVYYADNQQVSSTSNQGSITSGNSFTFTTPAWIISSAVSSVQVSNSGPSLVDVVLGSDGLLGGPGGTGLTGSVLKVSSPTTNEGVLWNGSAWVSAGTQTPLDNSVKPATTAYADAAVAVEASRAGTAEALLAPLASPTFTGTTTAPEFSASGLTGATAASRYVGATASGAPASGTFAKGDFVIDQTGIIWVCTTAGTSGTWTPIQPNVELGYAQITSNFIGGSAGPLDVTGLTVTVTVGARPIKVIFDASFVTTTTGAVKGVVVSYIMEGATVLANAFNTIDANADGASVHREARLAPSAGSHTYKIQIQATGASNLPEVSAGPTTPAFIQVVQI